MEQTHSESADRQSDDQPVFEGYLPGTPLFSGEPGRIERFLTRLFRRRGTYRVRLRRK
jgi:hypothetical protein